MDVGRSTAVLVPLGAHEMDFGQGKGPTECDSDMTAHRAARAGGARRSRAHGIPVRCGSVGVMRGEPVGADKD